MELQPPTAPLPPFWATVRRRHPDVDLVLLPDQGPVPPGDEVDDQAVASAVDRVNALVDALGAEPPAEARIGFGPDLGTVVPRVRLASNRDDGVAALDRLGDQLEELGWSVHRAEGGVARLVAHRDDLRVRASYAEQSGTFLLDVTAEPLPVGAERARELACR